MTDTIIFLTGKDMPIEERWLFNENHFENSPSRRDGVTAAKELSYRQQTAGLIQDMGKWIKTKQLVVDTAIVLMQRFYMLRSFRRHDKFVMASAALFLAGKSEEQPRRASDILKSRYSCLHPDKSPSDIDPGVYRNQIEEILEHEIFLLTTTGFDLHLRHPHMYVAGHKDLPKNVSVMAYNIVTTTFSLTTFCIKYKPSLIAAAAIYIACKWLKDAAAYWQFINTTITESDIKTVMDDFLTIMKQHPNRLQKLKNIKPVKPDQSQTSIKNKSKSGQSNPSMPAKIQKNGLANPSIPNRQTSVEGQPSILAKIHKASVTNPSIPNKQTSSKGQLSIPNKPPILEKIRPRSDDQQQLTTSKKIRQEQVASSTYPSQGDVSHTPLSKNSGHDDITVRHSTENDRKSTAKQGSSTSITKSKVKPNHAGKLVKMRNQHQHEREVNKNDPVGLHTEGKPIMFNAASTSSAESKLIGVISPYKGECERGNRVAKNWGYRQEHPMNRPAGVHLLRQDEIEVNHTVENHVSEIGESSMGGKLVTYPSLTVRIHASILLENPPKQDLTVQTHHSNNKPHIKKDRKRPRENIDNSSHFETVNQSRKKKKSKKERHFKCDQARLGRIITSKK